MLQHRLAHDRRVRHQRSSRRHFRDRKCAAVIRALTAARLYLGGNVRTLTEAAASCGSSVPYVRAAAVLIRAERTVLMQQALVGHVNLLKAAREAQGLARLVQAYRTAAPTDRIAFARVIGPTDLFDNVIAEAI